MSRTLLMSEKQIGRTLTRLAYEIVERNQGAQNLVFVGIRERGTALAREIARRIEDIEAVTPPVTPIDTAAYRDDRERPAATGASFSLEVTDRDVILVDDVLFTGRTARAALDAIVQRGRPRSIQFVVLIDRGHREYPIQPNFIGRRVQTKDRERVVVEAEEGINAFVVEGEPA